MRTRSLFPTVVVCFLVGATVSGGQLQSRFPGSSDQVREGREQGVIRGTVWSADGESPLAKATVSLRKSGSRRGAGERTARSDDRGQYEFSDLEAGKYLLSVTRNGFLPEQLSGVEVRVSPNGSRISGVVQSEEDGKAVDGATVLVFAADPRQRGSFSRFTRTTQTDQAGRYSLQGLPPGEYLVCALVEHEPGRESEPQYLDGLEGESAVIDLSAGEMSSKTLVALEAPAAN